MWIEQTHPCKHVQYIILGKGIAKEVQGGVIAPGNKL